MVGVRKPDGGYGKVLMRKSAKKPVSKMALSGKESESLGVPLRIKRFQKLPLIKRPAGNMRVVMRRKHLPRALPSPLLAPKMIACEISFGALTTT